MHMGIIIIIASVIVRFLLPSVFWPEGSVAWDPKAAAVISLRPDVLYYHAACDMANLAIVLGVAIFAVDYYFWSQARAARMKKKDEHDTTTA